jgi:hypothetical protein
MNSDKIANALLSGGIVFMSFGLIRMGILYEDIDKKMKYCLNGAAVCFLGGSTVELLSNIL